MSAESVTIATLRAFTPLDGLKRANLTALANKTHVRQLAAGRSLFAIGDSDKRTFYLVSGRLQLTDAHGNTKVIEGTTEVSATTCASDEQQAIRRGIDVPG